MIMAAAAEPDVSVAFSFRPVRHAPSDPMVVFSISGQKKRYSNYVVEPDGSTGYVHGFTTHDMPPRQFKVPFFLILFGPRLWAQRASSIVASSDDYYFRVGTAAHDRFLSRLCDLVPAKVDEAYSRGYCRLHVAVHVQMLIRRVVLSAAVPPRAGAGDPVLSPPRVVVPAEMRLKELREIGEGESCAICFEEFKGSKKKKKKKKKNKLAVTETPCSHVFHSGCLLPWLMTATTCPLCRATLY